MTEYVDNNRGALFRAEKTQDTDRDFSGSIVVENRAYWVSGRVKTSKKGTKYLSLSLTPKKNGAAKPTSDPDFSDPFI
jgi:hypothetical protein